MTFITILLTIIGIMFVLFILGFILHQRSKREQAEINQMFLMGIASVINGACVAAQYKGVGGAHQPIESIDARDAEFKIKALMTYFINDINAQYPLLCKHLNTTVRYDDVVSMKSLTVIPNSGVIIELITKLNLLNDMLDKRDDLPFITITIALNDLDTFINSINKQIDARKLKDLLCL